MSKNQVFKATPPDAVDQKKAAELADQIAKEFESLWEMLGKPKKGINRFQENDFIKLIDELDNIKYELIARTDGRPQPLDLSRGYRIPEDKRSDYPDHALKQMDELCEEYARFGECFEPGDGEGEKASLGSIHLSMKDLKTVREWLNQVIKWHQQYPVISKLK